MRNRDSPAVEKLEFGRILLRQRAKIIGYARGAEGIPDRGAKYGIVRSTIEYPYGIKIVYIPDRGGAAMR